MYVCASAIVDVCLRYNVCTAGFSDILLSQRQDCVSSAEEINSDDFTCASISPFTWAIVGQKYTVLILLLPVLLCVLTLLESGGARSVGDGTAGPRQVIDVDADVASETAAIDALGDRVLPLVASHLSKSFKTVKAVEDVSIKCNEECFGLLGPNGAGMGTVCVFG